MRWGRGFLRVWLAASLLWVLFAAPVTYWLAEFHAPVATLWRLQGWEVATIDCTNLVDVRREFCLAKNRLRVSMARSGEQAWQTLAERWWVPALSTLVPPLLLLILGPQLARLTGRETPLAPP